MSAAREFWSRTRTERRRYNRLWLAEHAARTVVRRQTRYSTKRAAAHEALVESALVRPCPRSAIDRVTDLSAEAFKAQYFDTQTPVILAGAGKNWAASAWTPERLAERYGDTQVRLLRVAPNQEKGRPGEGEDVGYDQVVESMQSGGDLYARFSGLLHQHPELVNDLDVEWFRTMRQDRKRFENWGFFMGGAGTATGLHSSIAPNLFYQITGEKRWYIYPAQAAPFFSPAVKCSPYFYSEVDVHDTDAWSIAGAVPGWVADLEPGDILWVPPFAWHQVHNFSPTIAVGYRWENVLEGIRASWIQALLVVTCSNPPPWKATNHKDLPTLLDAVDY